MELPLLTFLCGPSGVGKTTLANLLSDEVSACEALSLHAPVRGAILGGFFSCDPSLDLTKVPEQKLPGLDANVRSFSLSYLQFLKTQFGNNALGHIALAHIAEQSDYFEHFVLDDCWWLEQLDVRFLIDAVGPQNCLIVNLSRPGIEGEPLRSNRVNVLGVENNAPTPAALLDLFALPLNLTLKRHSRHADDLS